MKLAIATNDKQTIPKSHFGESRYFCVVDLHNGERFTDECRENPIPEFHTPGKSLAVLDLLGDCDVLVGWEFGRRLFSHATRVKQQAVLTPTSVIEEVVRAFSHGDMRGFRRLDPERKKFVPLEQALA